MDDAGVMLLEEALGWISNIMAEDNTRDGDPPTGAEISNWTNDWIPRTQRWLAGEESRFELFIDLDNDAWRNENGNIDGQHIAAALRAAAAKIECDFADGRVIDANGNSSGRWAIIKEQA